MIVLAAVVASGLGALARYAAAGAVHRRTSGVWPWGTAVVNVVGAAALGWLVGARASGDVGADAVTVVGTGFLGGFTTFSSWMVESVRLGEDGSAGALVAAAANVTVMLVVGVAAAAVGAR